MEKGRIMAYIKVENLKYRYPNTTKLALDGLDFEIEKGSFTAVLGHNGSGKSTLLSVIGARLKPYRGKVKLNEKTATMPQNPQLLFVKDSLLEDFKSVSGDLEKINKLSKKFNVHRLLNHHPYDLSGGEIQRAGFVKLLLLEPKILLLDEPTKGVDVGAKAQIYEIMSELAAQGFGVIMISSEMPEVLGMADTILVMKEGRVSKIFADATGVTQEQILEAAMNM